jgi:hypothetical protein
MTMTNDPAGLYARLGVDPSATEADIHAAYRRKARVLHPDVPGTGNADAFVSVKQAYDVLGNAEQRAAYDRSTHIVAAPLRAEPMVDEPMSAEEMTDEALIAWPPFSDLPIGLWIGIGGLFCLAVAMVVFEFSRPAPQQLVSTVRPFAPTVPPVVVAPASVPTAGAASHYVLPGGGDAILWRRDAAHDTFQPAGRIADFTPVLALASQASNGLVEIRLADGGSGFVDAARLAPGDRTTAHRAYCAYNSGTPPRNGEVLSRHGDGAAQLTIGNRGGEPAVVKLRDASGRAVASVFVDAGGTTVVGDLPTGVYRPEFAVGELWSRACDSFAAGMRAQRFAGYASVSGLSPLVIPPDLSVAPPPVDIPDQAFEQD